MPMVIRPASLRCGQVCGVDMQHMHMDMKGHKGIVVHRLYHAHQLLIQTCRCVQYTHRKQLNIVHSKRIEAGQGEDGAMAAWHKQHTCMIDVAALGAVICWYKYTPILLNKRTASLLTWVMCLASSTTSLGSTPYLVSSPLVLTWACTMDTLTTLRQEAQATATDGAQRLSALVSADAGTQETSGCQQVCRHLSMLYGMLSCVSCYAGTTTPVEYNCRYS